jgi:hypothetical protein
MKRGRCLGCRSRARSLLSLSVALKPSASADSHARRAASQCSWPTPLLRRNCFRPSQRSSNQCLRSSRSAAIWWRSAGTHGAPSRCRLMNTATLPYPILQSIGATFVNVLERQTREPLPHSLRALLHSIEAREKFERNREHQRSRPQRVGQSGAYPEDTMLSTAWRCQSCGNVTENPQPSFWPVPCPLCGGIYFTAICANA